ELLAALEALLKYPTHPFGNPDIPFVSVRSGLNRSLHEMPKRAPLQLWWLPARSESRLHNKDAAEEQSASYLVLEIQRLLRQSQAGDLRLPSDAEPRGRPLLARDIGVLVRTHKQGERLRNALAAAGLA